MARYQFTLPDYLPPGVVWGKSDTPGPQKQAPLPLEPSERDPFPPVTSHLCHQECLYGYSLTNELLETYWATHPAPKPTPFCNASRFGLDLLIDEGRGSVDPIAWFAYTHYGKVYSLQLGLHVPTAARLAPFEQELGIKEKAKWLADKFRAAMASIWRRLVILASSMFLRFGVDIESVGWLVGVSDARLQTGPGRNPVFFPNREKEIKRT
ncbi:hypothetical protein B0H16DRAFT_1460836 [Mycena metata]|uniref:Uncharacterized protein n=1 Tax=Mycena metata TaxID=1033252 RepID=A0AAD7IWN4_9AGAR|nr:hypothetical protein B0H16DRAFT_1460836 [Mycena metata]